MVFSVQTAKEFVRFGAADSVGGVVAIAFGVRVFIPASLTGLAKDEDLTLLVKEKVKFRIIDIDDRKRRVIGSIRSVTNEARKAAADAFWATAEEGKTYTGTVKSILDFGAFVEFMPGKEGLLHISEISWERLESMEACGIKEGDTVTVKLIEIDKKTGKFRLSMKALLEKPEGWEERAPRAPRTGYPGAGRRRRPR